MYTFNTTSSLSLKLCLVLALLTDGWKREVRRCSPTFIQTQKMFCAADLTLPKTDGVLMQLYISVQNK